MAIESLEVHDSGFNLRHVGAEDRLHVALAEERAAAETDESRRAELLKIADVCRRVPAEAPRDFHEALQAYWFCHLGVITELNGWDSFSPGHLDQHLWPFYRAGLEDGTLTELPLIGVIDRIQVVDAEGTPRKGKLKPRIVFGPTCDSVDRLPGEIALPAGLAEGDYLIWHGMGSYSVVTNSRFNGFGDLQMATVLSLKV